MKYKNIATGAVLTETEYVELLQREYREMWENNTIYIVDQFKEEGKTFQNFLEYMTICDTDTDFIVVDDTDEKILDYVRETKNITETLATLNKEYLSISSELENSYRENETLWIYSNFGELLFCDSEQDEPDLLPLGQYEAQDMEDWETDTTNVLDWCSDMLECRAVALLNLLQQNIGGMCARMQYNTYTTTELENIFDGISPFDNYNFDSLAMEEYIIVAYIGNVEYGLNIDYKYVGDLIEIKNITLI